MTEQFRERVLAAAAEGKPLRIRGGGSKDFYGGPLVGEVLDTRGHAGIVAYEPTELVVTARAGTPLAELEATLAEQGQMLAFEAPHFGDSATLGGCVAAGLSGPRRATAGSVRDFLLGAKLLDGKGEVLNFGGQVMKNVAGYDVSRLMAGAMGTLGLLLEVSLKVLPRPAAELTLRLELPEAKALETMNRWAGQPLPVSATCWEGTPDGGELTVRLSGARAAVRAARERLGGEELAQADGFWRDVREQQLAFFVGKEALWRLSVPSASSPLALAGTQLFEWGGALRWLKSNAEPQQVREVAAAAGGHATLFRGGERSGGVFAPLPDTLMKLHRNLKRAFDPQGIFNPGRLYPEL